MLLLPGGFCTALSYIDFVVKLSIAPAGITTLAANPPGFATNPPPDGFTHSTTEYAELIEELAETERLDLLVGHSLSANILIEVAARGNYTGPVVLLGPCLRVRNEYRGVRILRKLEHHPPLARRAYRSMSKDFHRSMAGLIRPDRLDLITEDMKRTPPEQNRAVINGYFDHLEQYGTLANRLADATTEIHYVRGDAESSRLRSRGRRAHRRPGEHRHPHDRELRPLHDARQPGRRGRRDRTLLPATFVACRAWTPPLRSPAFAPGT